MTRQPVSSSNVASVGYDGVRHELEVEFRSGAVYVYSGVSIDVHARMMAQASIGSFIARQVKDVYPARKVERVRE